LNPETLSGPQGIIGEHMKNSVELALDLSAGRSAARRRGDLRRRPVTDVGKQLAEDARGTQFAALRGGCSLVDRDAGGPPTVTGAGSVIRRTMPRIAW